MEKMGLNKQQRILARLYTDLSLREEFLENPQGVGKRFGLSARETEQASRLSAPQLNFFADSLKHKRLSEVLKLLPLSRRALGERFGTLFRRYADTHVPTGTRKHLDDVVAFARFTRENAHDDRLEPWIIDLMQYETECRRVWGSARWRMRWFRYPVGKLVRKLTQDGGVPEVRAQPTISVWFRLSRRGPLRHVVLSLPLAIVTAP